jgi:hypothetical protein
MNRYRTWLSTVPARDDELLALSVGLVITVVGIPLLIGTLYAVRLMGRVERARARALLGTSVAPAPPTPRGWHGWLTDAAGWRALGHAVLLGRVGVLTAL